MTLEPSQSLIAELEALFSGEAVQAWSRIKDSRQKFGEYGEKLLEACERALPRHGLRNQTDWNHDFSFSFEFVCEEHVAMPHLSHEGHVDALHTLGRPLSILWVDVSAVQPFVYSYFHITRLRRRGSVLEHEYRMTPADEHQQRVQEIIYFKLGELGVTPIEPELLSEPVPNVSCMDLAEPSEVCVYTCLFHDGYGGCPPAMGTWTEPCKR